MLVARRFVWSQFSFFNNLLHLLHALQTELINSVCRETTPKNLNGHHRLAVYSIDNLQASLKALHNLDKIEHSDVKYI